MPFSTLGYDRSSRTVRTRTVRTRTVRTWTARTRTVRTRISFFNRFCLFSLVSKHVEVCPGRISTRRIRIWGQTLPILATRAEKIETRLSGTYLSGPWTCFCLFLGLPWSDLDKTRWKSIRPVPRTSLNRPGPSKTTRKPKK